MTIAIAATKSEPISEDLPSEFVTTILELIPSAEVLPELTLKSAPISRAFSNAASLISTAITFAPSALAIITADNPTPPHPNTATHSPGCTLAREVNPRNDVAKRHPSPAAVSKEIASGSAIKLKSALLISTYSANDPQCVKPG